MQNLQLSLQELCNIFIQSSDMVYAHSDKGIVTYVNENIQDKIGYTPGEILGKFFAEFVHPDDIPKSVDLFERAKNKDVVKNFCIRIRHKNGNFLHIDFTAHAIFKNDVFMGAIGVGHDVTAKKITEDALGQSEKIYKVLVDNAMDVIYTVNPEGIVTSCNDFMKNVTGFSADEVIGRQYTYFLHPDEIEFGARIHNAIMRGEKPPVIEMRFLKKSGDYLHAEFSTTPLFYDGKFLGTLGIGRDVTERKKNEENLKLALLKEKQLNELKQHFISIVSHEFRNPLMVINGTAEVLELEFKNNVSSQSAKDFNKIKTNVKRITKMLDEIMMLCNENNQALLKLTPVNIVDFCAEIIEDIKRSLLNPGDNMIIFKHCTKVTRDSTFKIDRDIMRHILINLLTNAIKYSNDKTEVNFHVATEEKFLKFTISDKGIGIPEEYMKNIFQNFSRASNVGKIKGTGMGLAIVKKCVEVHNGDIFIESILNQGTKVIVKIPLS